MLTDHQPRIDMLASKAARRERVHIYEPFVALQLQLQLER